MPSAGVGADLVWGRTEANLGPGPDGLRRVGSLPSRGAGAGRVQPGRSPMQAVEVFG